MAQFTVTYILFEDKNGDPLPFSLHRELTHEECPVIPRAGEEVSSLITWQEDLPGYDDLVGKGSSFVVKKVSHYPNSVAVILEISPLFSDKKKIAEAKNKWSVRAARGLQLFLFMIGTGVIGFHLGMTPLAASLSVFAIWVAVAIEKPIQEHGR